MAFTPSNMQRGSTKNTAGMFRGPSSVQKLDSDLRFSSVGKRYSSKVSGPNGAQISEWDNMRMSRVEKIVEEELEELMKGSSISERSAYGASQLASEALAVDSQDICTVNGGNDPEPASDTPTNRRARESMIVTYNEQRETETKISKLKWTQRKRKGGSFVRTRHSDAQVEARKSEVVMATPSAEDEPWEAYLQPGCYRLADIVAFPDVDTPIPKFAKFWVPKDNWKGTEGEGSGTLAIDFQELRRKVPIETATDILLRFYGCSLISDKSIGQVELGDEHVIQDFMYSKDYFRKYVTGVGAGIERHEFAHIDCPLSPLDESGFFLLGKWIEEGEDTFLCITMFRVPQLHALYVPGGTIHSNDYLRGTWRTMLSWTADLPIDHVTLSSIEEDGSTKKDCFKIKDFDLLKD